MCKRRRLLVQPRGYFRPRPPGVFVFNAYQDFPPLPFRQRSGAIFQLEKLMTAPIISFTEDIKVYTKLIDLGPVGAGARGGWSLQCQALSVDQH